MSEDKPEMVTMTFDVTVEDARFLHERAGKGFGFCKAQAEAAGKALDARKSLYERWRERVDADSGDEILGMFEHLNQQCGYNYTTAALLAASMKMLDALISTDIELWALKLEDSPLADIVRAAVRAAVPKDVAEEQLEEKNKVASHRVLKVTTTEQAEELFGKGSSALEDFKQAHRPTRPQASRCTRPDCKTHPAPDCVECNR